MPINRDIEISSLCFLANKSFQCIFLLFRMKRDDIIQQKLFEAYKLSEFYLDLIVDDNYNPNNYRKGEQEETPFQLSKSFSCKLQQIISRYDALLEQNDFEHKANNISTPTSTVKKNKKLNYSQSRSSNNSIDDDDDDDDDWYQSSRRSSSVKTIKLVNQQQQQITKSFSNLSKDSGIVLDLSRYSDSNSNITTSFISERLNDDDDDDDDSFTENDRNDDSSSTTSTINNIEIENDDDNNNDGYNWYMEGFSQSSLKFLCDDNDSLMSVSMIDNIEAIYKNSDKNDSMCSSILTFV